ncbi:MAG TPA: hypothetical protein VHE55_09855 [Fimbriimonadaceae bacterium]|nr:hypothetical protein [Fimbriimonadaceae bacterium]
MTALDQVTVETFQPHVGSEFRLAMQEGQPPIAMLTLQGATPSKYKPDSGRVPFSLFFDGPAQPALGQDVYCLSHDSLGDMTIFIVPVSGDSQSRRYQAVFS